MSSSADELLRDAWLSVEGDGPGAQAFKQSLEASVHDDAALLAVVADLKSPTQAELDLHLAGGDIVDHRINAKSFGRFVTRLGDAVKEIAKGISRSSRGAADLQLLAPVAGSVRVVFRAPDHPTSDATARPGLDPPSATTLALAQVSGIMQTAADSTGLSEATFGAMQDLSPAARRAVSFVAKSIVDNDWELEGQLRSRGNSVQAIHLTPTNARQIMAAATELDVVGQPVKYEGYIDGQRRSMGAMWFKPRGRPAFAASVPRLDLMAEVARLAADPDQDVIADFVRYVTQGSGVRPRISYVLQSIEPVRDVP